VRVAGGGIEVTRTVLEFTSARRFAGETHVLFAAQCASLASEIGERLGKTWSTASVYVRWGRGVITGAVQKSLSSGIGCHGRGGETDGRSQSVAHE